MVGTVSQRTECSPGQMETLMAFVFIEGLCMAHSPGNGKARAGVIKGHPVYSLLESKDILIFDPLTDIFKV